MTVQFKEALKKARGIQVDEAYYASTYEDNIYPPQMAEKHIRMFCKGEGKELFPKDGKKEKAACIYSSSMLAYNFFSWVNEEHPLHLGGITYNKVVFEEQFRVLQNRNNKANIDVALVSNDEKTILLFESKFTEQFSQSKVDIKEAYDDSDSYFDSGEEWIRVFKQIEERMKKDEKTYFEGLKQVACHLIGISSVIRNHHAREWFNQNSWLHHINDITLSENKNYIFKSLVFHPKTKEESDRTADYMAKNDAFVSGITFLPKNLSIENPIITYRDVWDAGLRESIKDEELRHFLENYLLVHV